MATIDDVAKAAGVSTSTVSYVLSGKRPISAPTRSRVEKAIKDLGYRPHAGARALASSHTNVLALVAPLRAAVNVNIIMMFVSGIAQAARKHNYDVLLLTQDDAAGMERVTSGSMVDAVITMDIEEDDPRIPLLANAKQPSVLVGLPRDAGGLSCVDLDFTSAGSCAVRHFAELGHKRVGLIGAGREVWERHTSFHERLLLGANTQAKHSGIELTAIPCESTEMGAYQAVDALLAQAPDLTALVIHNEFALPYAIARLRELGKSIPQDISVLAICPSQVAESQPLPLTAIDLPAEAIARAAVEMAILRIQAEQPGETRLLAPVLTERGSTAKPQL